MSHFVQYGSCGHVIAQCRCPGIGDRKQVDYLGILCDSCGRIKQAVDAGLGYDIAEILEKQVSVLDERGHTSDVDVRYRHHVPTAEQIRGMNAIREAANYFDDLIQREAPPCRGRATALTHLEETVMWANKAVLLGEATNVGKR